MCVCGCSVARSLEGNTDIIDTTEDAVSATQHHGEPWSTSTRIAGLSDLVVVQFTQTVIALRRWPTSDEGESRELANPVRLRQLVRRADNTELRVLVLQGKDLHRVGASTGGHRARYYDNAVTSLDQTLITSVFDGGVNTVVDIFRPLIHAFI